MIAECNIKEDVGVTTCDTEARWRDFLVSVMAQTVTLCEWLCSTQARTHERPLPKTLHRRLLNSATAWRWVFGDPEPASELPMSEVCLFLGLDPDMIRAKILDACRPQPDINQVLDRIFLECGCFYAKPERQTARSRGVGSVDWARLRDFRRDNPSGSRLEDFRSPEVGGGQDRNAGG